MKDLKFKATIESFMTQSDGVTVVKMKSVTNAVHYKFFFTSPKLIFFEMGEYEIHIKKMEQEDIESDENKKIN